MSLARRTIRKTIDEALEKREVIGIGLISS